MECCLAWAGMGGQGKQTCMGSVQMEKEHQFFIFIFLFFFT